MLYIRVELWRKGNRHNSKLLGEAAIANVGGDLEIGHYLVVLSKFGGFKLRKSDETHEDPETMRVARPLASSTWKRGKVGPFNRQLRGPWDLLYQSLRDVIGYRN